MTPLDTQVLDAHADGRLADLVRLYAEAADQANDHKARAFYLTHAYVFALDTGHADAEALRVALADMGCETP